MDRRQHERAHMSMFDAQVIKYTDSVGSSSNTCREKSLPVPSSSVCMFQ